jgi:hypothetical protein
MQSKIIGKCVFNGKVIIGDGNVPFDPNTPYQLWDFFGSSSGITLNNFSIQYNPSNTVLINWGDGTNPENINSGTNYNHTFN